MRVRAGRLMACRGIVLFISIMAFFLASVGGRAQTVPATTEAAATSAPSTAPDEPLPHHVNVGIYVNQIKSVDLKTNSFVVDFWIWFRWKGTSIKPMESFEIVGGHVDSKENEVHDVVKGYNYAAARVTATVTKFFDIARFPLDAHALAIEVEDGEMEKERLVFEGDVKNSGLSPDLLVPGWHIQQTSSRVVDHEYATNYGNIALETGNKSVYSRFIFQIDLRRPGMGFYFKLFWSLFLATVIALLAMLIDPIDLDPRFGLGVGAIFAAIASAYVISSSLPETNQYTLADKLNMLAVGIIFLSIVQSVFSLRLWKGGREAASKKFDRICFWGMLAAYGIGCLVFSVG